MEAEREKGLAQDIDMSLEENMAQEKPDEVKQTYKSFKKKYRKMRIKFDEKMRQSNELFVEEQLAVETAKRLAQENDRLLDLLLDVNNSAQIPADKRIDLDVDIPGLSTLPPLVSTEDISKATELETLAGQAIYSEIRSMLEEKAATKAASKPPKSLALLMATTPHLSSNSPLVSPDLLTSLEAPEGLPAPISYITLDQMDDYIYDIDASLGTAPPPPPHTHSPTAQDLQLRNPNSVYNWLRRNEPKIFLQDGEGSEKSLGKPGALRGAGKRASIPAPAKPDSLEFVEEDGIGYDAALSGPVITKGKRKREEDDGGYHPKKGSVDSGKKPRPKKKKTESSAETTGSSGSKKAKGKGRTSSPLAGEPPAFAT